jgi:succinate dehydrogenase / fumarate reductase flavoprotein subunit
LFALGECNFSDHGANRLGASALMQGLADGYFVIPYTVGTFLSNEIRTGKIDPDGPQFVEAANEVKKRLSSLMAIKGNQSVESMHRKLGHIMWEYCGMARNAEGLKTAQKMVSDLRDGILQGCIHSGQCR